MLDVIKEYIEESRKHSICEKYRDLAERAMSKRQLMDVCLDASAIPFVAKSIAMRWGITPGYIIRNFSQFINGKYIYDNDYTSSLYVGCDTALIETTMSLIANCKKVVVPENAICELHIVGDCDVDFNGVYAKVYRYDSKGNVKKQVYGKV